VVQEFGGCKTKRQCRTVARYDGIDWSCSVRA
jgi:hypothetical protein